MEKTIGVMVKIMMVVVLAIVTVWWLHGQGVI